MPPLLHWRRPSFEEVARYGCTTSTSISWVSKILLSTGVQTVVGIFTTVFNKRMHPTSPYIWLRVHYNFKIDVMSKNVTVDFIDGHIIFNTSNDCTSEIERQVISI